MKETDKAPPNAQDGGSDSSLKDPEREKLENYKIIAQSPGFYVPCDRI